MKLGDLQREAQSPVRLHKAARIGLALLVLLGAAFFIATGAILLTAVDRAGLAHPAAAVVMMLLFIAMGVAFGYVGFRLLRVRRHEDHLFSARGARIASYCVAALTLATAAGGLISGQPEFAATVVIGLPMAWWLYRSKASSR